MDGVTYSRDRIKFVKGLTRPSRRVDNWKFTMTGADETHEPSRRTLAELSALADGSLDPKRAGAVRELIARSPELSERYERERRAVDAVHSVRADRAPAHLRLRIDQRRNAVSKRRPRVMYGGVLAAATAVVVVALVLLLPGGTPGSPSVSQAAALSMSGPTLGAPAASRYSRAILRQDVGEVYFPDWSRWFGWRADGQRVDHLGGQVAKTVYYTRAGKQIAYTILARPALPWPGAPARQVNGTVLQTFGTGGRLVVTWRRAGHTCVLSGRGVSPAELMRLAAWKAPGLMS